MSEKQILTDNDLRDTLGRIVFNNTALDFKWRFEYQPITAKYDGNSRYFDATANKEVFGRDVVRKGWIIWASFERPDTNTNIISRGRGRDEVIWEGWTESAVIKTAWVIVEMLIKHELMEGFQVRQDDHTLARIFNPHHSVEALASLEQARRFDFEEQRWRIPSNGLMMTISDFYANKAKYLPEYGNAYLATEAEYSSHNAHDFTLWSVPEPFTHVLWFEA